MDDWDLDTTPPQPAAARPARAGELSAGPAPERGKVEPVESCPPAGGGADGSRAGTSRPPTGRKGTKITLAKVLAALAILIAGLLIGFFLARSQASDEKAKLAGAQADIIRLTEALSRSEERNWRYYLAVEALESELEQYQTPPSTGGQIPTTTVPPFEPGRVYGDGVYMVGEDIAVGSYDGVVAEEVGYWARLRGTDGAVSSIIANGLPRGPFVLTIVTSDKAVELRGVRLTLR